MDRYKVVIWWSDIDDRFVAEMPELAGCMSDGATKAEALANIQIVAQEWIETARELGRDIPQPQAVAA